VFMDGSVKLPHSQWLSHAGWGFFVAQDSEANDWGALEDYPHTSFRAELRALVAVVSRAVDPVSIVIDNQAVFDRFASLIDLRNESSAVTRCPIGEHEDLLWKEVWWHLANACPLHYHTQWCPSHLLEPKNATRLDESINEGGDVALLEGNRDADSLAERGALIAAPPMYLQQREFVKRKAARIVQSMQVHIWAAFQGYAMGDQES
jgi:ribonuclease HI